MFAYTKHSDIPEVQAAFVLSVSGYEVCHLEQLELAEINLFLNEMVIYYQEYNQSLEDFL